MCPGAVVQGGGGAGGGAGGNGNKGGPGQGGGNDGGSGQDGTDGGSGANQPDAQQDCGTASHPVDVGTGRAFTHPIVDFELSGPLPLRFERSASSFAAGIDQGMGPSWAHTFGWQIEERRRVIRVWSDKGGYVDFPKLDVGQKAIGLWGWVLEREAWGYQLDVDDGTWRLFSVQSAREVHRELRRLPGSELRRPEPGRSSADAA
jgi:hypothetical protein